VKTRENTNPLGESIGLGLLLETLEGHKNGGLGREIFEIWRKYELESWSAP
jgi:hypothetical protein